jgi:hypothetical protein
LVSNVHSSQVSSCHFLQSFLHLWTQSYDFRIYNYNASVDVVYRVFL